MSWLSNFLTKTPNHRRLERLNRISFENATVCMCGKLAVVKVQDRFSTPYKPTFGQCAEHKGLPLDYPWIQHSDGSWRPADPRTFTRRNIDGSPAHPELPIIVEILVPERDDL